MVDISIIVVTYNSQWDKLKKTIESIICQKNITFEVVFADDGSEIKWNEKIKESLPESIKYIFADLNENSGTVSNINNALQYTEGRYIKVISPGDYFNGSLAARKWVDFMDSTKADVSFCNAIYYKNVDGLVSVLKNKQSPHNVYIYNKADNRKKLFVDYLLANDTILGASVLMDRNVIVSYIAEINKYVKYAEDYMIRLMIFDNRRIIHLDEELLWYEYGEGVSNGKNQRWASILKDDFDATNYLIEKRQNITEKIQKKYVKYLRLDNKKSIEKKLKKVIMFPSIIWFRGRMKL